MIMCPLPTYACACKGDWCRLLGRNLSAEPPKGQKPPQPMKAQPPKAQGDGNKA
jgi:hypothetical protein